MGLLDHYLIEGWREAHKLWSVRVALFWAAFNGALIAFSSVGADHLSPLTYAIINTGGYVILGAARLTKQTKDN